MTKRAILAAWSIRCFYLSALWATATAFVLHRAYQDSWMLAGLWLPLAVMMLFYLTSVWLSTNLIQITFLSAIVTGLLHGVPALKYASVYLSTIDNTVHVSLIRTIANTGHVEKLSSYASTPGFHAFVAALAQVSGIAPESLARIAPSFVGAITPLTFYTICRRFNFPAQLTKLTIIFSAFSMPVLYTLNGTSFVVPLLLSLITVFFISRSVTRTPLDLPYRLMLILFMTTLVFWHPGTSIILPGIMILVGLAAVRLYRGSMLPHLSHDLVWFGITGGIGAMGYWLVGADFVMQRFAVNIATALTADSKVLLVPSRLFELTLEYQVLIAAFNHSRDLVAVGLAMIGVLYLVFARRPTQLAQFIRVYALIWAAFLGLLMAVFVASFGDQGYQRFLGYVVGLSPILAGYGLWRLLQGIERVVGVLRIGPTAAALFVVIAFMFSVQVYPYQPLVPTLTGKDEQEVPIVWIHQVNTTYQHHLMTWVFERLIPTVNLDTTQVLADYIGYQQGALYYDIRAKQQMRRSIDQKRMPAYILLHRPGRAGAFMEQAEYRSNIAIERWFDSPLMDVIYDNGESFVMYNPLNAEEPFYLERAR